jgi:hypothetical protein
MMTIDDVFAETDRLVNEEKHRIRSWWFVTAHTVNGGRFYSEPFEMFDDACSYYDNIKGLVQYFGGGHVEMLRISDYDYDVVAISRI